MNYKKTLIFGLLVVTNIVNAKNIVYQDDIYMHQANPELVKLVDSVVQEVGYTGDYELIEPNKAALVINPWNSMVGSAVNPQTQNNFIVINNEWFKGLSLDEQKFLVARCLIKFEHGALPELIKPLPGIKLDLLRLLILGLFCLVIMLLFWLINKTTLRSKSRWMKWSVVLFIAFVLDSTLLTWGHQKVINCLVEQYNSKINQIVLTKLPNKQAAISALECVDAVVKEGLKNGEMAYKDHENIYFKMVKELKNK